MKVILAIFCGAVALFAGGCALVLLGDSSSGGVAEAMPYTLMLGGIAVLNIIVLVGLFSSRSRQRWAYYLLGTLDLLLALSIAMIWIGSGDMSQDSVMFALFWIGIVLLKGGLTIYYARRP